MEFKHLTAEEFKALSTEDKLNYAQKKEEFTQKRLNDLFEKYDETKAKSEDTTSLVASIKEAQHENNEALKNLTSIVAQIVKNGVEQPQAFLTPFESIKKGLTEAMPDLMKAKEAKKLGFFNVKAAATMLESNNLSGTRYPQPEYVPGLKLIAERNPFILDVVNTGSTSSAVITYVEEKNPDGDFAMTAEGALKPLLDFDMVPADSKAKKCAGVIKVSDEMLADIDFMASEINRRLKKKHDLKLEDIILNGDGTGENFTGINVLAPAFSAGALALQVVAPNVSDVIRAAINQIVVSSDGAYYPNYAYLNPSDIALMELQKDTTGNYVMPPFMATNGTMISGVQVVGKTKITAGRFLVGDFSEATFRNYKPFAISMGWENDDFRKNLVTIIGESRSHFYVMSNSLTAFVEDSIATAKTALTKP